MRILIVLALTALWAMLAYSPTMAQVQPATNPFLAAILDSQKNGRPLTAQERLQQEQALYQHLKSLTQEQVAAIQQKIAPALMQKIVERLKVLKQWEKSGTQGVDGGPNTVTSGASSVRHSGTEANSLGGKGTGSTGSSRTAMMARMAAAARTMMSQRRRRPMDPISGYRSFTNEARGAMNAGCSYPIATESIMETFVAGSGGCAMSAAMCYMRGQSCVDVGMSIMCCPPGYSSGTLRMLDQMKQMQSLINTLS